MSEMSMQIVSPPSDMHLCPQKPTALARIHISPQLSLRHIQTTDSPGGEERETNAYFGEGAVRFLGDTDRFGGVCPTLFLR